MPTPQQPGLREQEGSQSTGRSDSTHLYRPSAEAAQAELDAFADGRWGQRFPTISAAWRNAWGRVIPFFGFPPAVRRVLYTTNAIENTNAQLRKIIKTRGHFPADKAATKLIWLALRNITATWKKNELSWNGSRP